MPRGEFCQSRDLSFGTLNRHLKKQRWTRNSRRACSASRLLPVELAARKSPTQHQPSCGLAVVLSGGRRIEVQRDFDVHTFERLVMRAVVRQYLHTPCFANQSGVIG